MHPIISYIRVSTGKQAKSGLGIEAASDGPAKSTKGQGPRGASSFASVMADLVVAILLLLSGNSVAKSFCTDGVAHPQFLRHLPLARALGGPAINRLETPLKPQAD
jgi:hypothetical protein